MKYIDDKKQFIHFKTKEDCQRFRQWYRGSIGHTCCFGKGCLLPDITTRAKVIEIEQQFKQNNV